jgi:hypothetical protein
MPRLLPECILLFRLSYTREQYFGRRLTVRPSKNSCVNRILFVQSLVPTAAPEFIMLLFYARVF